METLGPLDLLLAAAEELQESRKEQESKSIEQQKSIQEIDLFKQQSNLPIKSVDTVSNETLLHTGDTDSSDDEDKRTWEESKYHDSGRDIKRLLNTPTKNGAATNRISHVSIWNKSVIPSSNAVKKDDCISLKSGPGSTVPITKSDVYTDPIFGLRIINPLISSVTLKDRMLGRETVPFSKLNRFLQTRTQESDWVLAGAVVNKSASKTSQKGNQFSVWTVSDLKDDIKTAAIFLFGSAHQQYWKTSVGTIVGLLNPNVLEKKDGRDEASLSIDNAQKIMVFGQSKDFGTCKSVKKNGDRCTAIVNINRCEYCIYHIKQEYQKCSIRSDLQSSYAGKGLTALRNKVLGKNEVFYAGKSYMAIPAKGSKKFEKKDNARLNGLNMKPSLQTKSTCPGMSMTKKKSNAPRLEVSHAQRVKDLKLLEKLTGHPEESKNSNFEGKQSSDVTVEDAKSLAESVLNKLKAKKQSLDSFSSVYSTKSKLKNISTADETNKLKTSSFVEENINKMMPSSSMVTKSQNVFQVNKIVNTLVENKMNGNNLIMGFPKLTGFDTGSIDLSKPIHSRRTEKAKLNAIKVIQKKGPLQKADPNNIRGTGIKRLVDLEDGDKLKNDTKKAKVDNSDFTSERFKKIMAAGSNHQDLLEARDNEEKEKYFQKLEVKEKMEEKMITTHKVACKAVKCVQCKYVSFSASDLCKSEKHPLKVFDAVKRFFKCGHCQNRTVCLEIMPIKPCNNCGDSNWQKTGMMKEKLATASHVLSIRGGEQKFTNSVASDSNLNLLVPD